MWSASEAFSGLIPNCACGAAFDQRFHAPYSLPCAHTFCFMCLSEKKQVKTSKCPLCSETYSTFIRNAALAEVIERVRRRRDWLDLHSIKCDECESRRSIMAMRRCISCTSSYIKHLSRGCTLDCILCLECCVDRHNGHEFISLISTSLSLDPKHSEADPSSVPRSMGISRTCANISKLAQHIEKRHNNDTSYPRFSSVSSTIEEDVVYEVKSPLYYQLATSLNYDVAHSRSIVGKLSALFKKLAIPCNLLEKS